jgi:hypothetical protein
MSFINSHLTDWVWATFFRTEHYRLKERNNSMIAATRSQDFIANADLRRRPIQARDTASNSSRCDLL